MNNYIITRASDTNELYHHGVKGMKWGVRHQKKYQNLVDYTKRKHSESRYNQEVKGYSNELRWIKKQGYSKWAKKNHLDSLSKKDQETTYNDYMKELQSNRKLYKRKREHKIDCVAALMDAFIAWKQNKDAFE